MPNTRQSLVLVLGAGASKEAGFPVGSELKRSIADLLDIRYDFSRLVSGDAQSASAIRLLANGPKYDQSHHNKIQHACWHIRDAMPQAISIDNFIDCNSDKEHIADCGKIGIARALLQAEAQSNLAIDSGNIYNKIDFAEVENTWFNRFFQAIYENCRAKDLPKRLGRVTIISFNYDRSVEHYLFNALQNYYRVDEGTAAELMQHLKIYHPYGKIGDLPWMAGNTSIRYGADVDTQTLVAAARGLRTFTEGTDPADSQIQEIRRAVQNTDRLAFLGFAYHPLNLDLLFDRSKSDLSRERGTAIVGTAYGISEANRARISNRLHRTGIAAEAEILLRDMTCTSLMEAHSWDLSLRY